MAAPVPPGGRVPATIEPSVARTILVEGVVQGVGFRPFVWRLATELELAGRVRNAAGRVEVEAAGSVAALDAFARRLRTDAPPRARVERVTVAPARRRSGRGPPDPVRHRRKRLRRGDRSPVPARHRHLRRLPARAARPRRPAVPLPVHQLHQLRAARDDHRGAPVRPGADDDARLPPVRRLRCRVPRPGGPAVPRRARRLCPACGPRLAWRPTGAPAPGRERRGRAGGGGGGPQGRCRRRGQGPRRLSPGMRRHRRCRRAPPARPQAALGQAVRGDGPRPRRRPRPVPRRRAGAAAPRGPGPPDRPARGAARSASPRWPRRSRPATGGSACSCPTPRSTTCCSRPSAARSCSPPATSRTSRWPPTTRTPSPASPASRTGSSPTTGRSGRATTTRSRAWSPGASPSSAAPAGTRRSPCPLPSRRRCRCSPSARSSSTRSPSRAAGAPTSRPHNGDLEDLATHRAFTDGLAHLSRLLALEPEVVVHDLHPEYLSTKYAIERFPAGEADRRPAPPRARRVVCRRARHHGSVPGRRLRRPGHGRRRHVLGRRGPPRRPAHVPAASARFGRAPDARRRARGEEAVSHGAGLPAGRGGGRRRRRDGRRPRTDQPARSWPASTRGRSRWCARRSRARAQRPGRIVGGAAVRRRRRAARDP